MSESKTLVHQDLTTLATGLDCSSSFTLKVNAKSGRCTMLIGYASTKLEKICTLRKEALKALSQESADVLPRRLEDLAAFNNLAEIPIRQTPLHFHPLREDRSGDYVIKLKGGDGVVFRPTGDFDKSEDGTPILASVTKIEVTFVGNYHSND